MRLKGAYLTMNNSEFLCVLEKSFEKYIECGTSRSTEKLKPLHGSIAKDLQEKFGEQFTVKSQGFGEGKESKIEGRYYDKKVDITVEHKGKAVAGYAVKFVMRNYSQNSNNYFENMLGETANIRTNNIPYFQIFISFDEIPYYDKNGNFKKTEKMKKDKLNKYLMLSRDNSDTFWHTPDKMLIVLLSLKDDQISYSKKIDDYFDSGVILNNYEDFIERTIYIVKGKMKN